MAEADVSATGPRLPVRARQFLALLGLAATVSALGRLSAVVLAALLTANSGAGAPINNCRSGRRIPHDARVIAAGPDGGARRDLSGACLSQPTPTRVDRWIDRRLSNRILRPRYAARLIAVIWLVTVIVFGILEWIVDPETFDTVWLAFWWALQTITTVGYGDVVPNDTDGKVVGAILMLGGLSLISVITAVVTSAFVTRRQAELQAAGEDPVMQELKQIAARLERMEAELRRSASDDSS